MTRCKRASLCVGAVMGVLAILAATGFAEAAPASSYQPEPTPLTVGVTGHNIVYLPIHIAAGRTAREENLDIRIVSFGGGPRVAVALASDSVDFAVTSLTTLIGMIGAGYPMRGFYVGPSPADYEWFARRGITSWSDMRGKSVATTAHGSFSDALTRYVLRKRGLRPGEDILVVQMGESATRLTALQAGRVDAAILTPPFTWRAEELGFTRLGSQAAEVAPVWPQTVVYAKDRFLAEHSHTVRAFLRAYVKAVRLARGHPETAVQILMTQYKYERRDAVRAYAEVMAEVDESGKLPTQAMPRFWEIAMAAGEVKEPWAESRFLDRRFIDTFKDWAPK